MESGFLLLLVGAALVGAPRARVMAGSAAVAVGLALAALRAGPQSATASLPPGFVAVDVALLVAGLVLAGAASIPAFRTARASGQLAGLALLAGVGVILIAASPLLASAPPAAAGTSLVIAVAIGGAAAALGRWVRLPADPPGSTYRPAGALAGVAVGTALAGLGPHVALVFIGVLLAAWSGYGLQRMGNGPRFPISPAIALLLAPAHWLLTTIAGPEGLRTATLSMLPLSPAAERLLAPVLLLVGWSLAGLWPLHRQGKGVLLAAAGMLLLVRVAFPAVPDGLDHWRALAMPVVVLGLWHAALSGRWSAIPVALGWVALLGGGAGAVPIAALLLAIGLVLQFLTGANLPARWTEPVGVAAALALGGGGLLAVEKGLGGEVVYTVLAALAMVAALAGMAAPQAMTPSAPSATAPSE